MDAHAAQRLVRLNPQLLRVSVATLARPGAAALAAMLGLQPDELRRLVTRCNDGAFACNTMLTAYLTHSMQHLVSRRLNALHGSTSRLLSRAELPAAWTRRCQDFAASWDPVVKPV